MYKLSLCLKILLLKKQTFMIMAKKS